jgi:hypothetical protein
MLRIATRCALLALATALVTAGCGPSEPTGPKETLTDKEKQQIEELNKQRQEEWGVKKKDK